MSDAIMSESTNLEEPFSRKLIIPAQDNDKEVIFGVTNIFFYNLFWLLCFLQP